MSDYFLALEGKFRASQIIITTNFVIPNVSIKKVDCITSYDAASDQGLYCLVL